MPGRFAIFRTPGLSLAAIAWRRRRMLAGKYGAKAYSSYEDMVKSDDIDILTIATPSGLHMEPAVAAAERAST